MCCIIHQILSQNDRGVFLAWNIDALYYKPLKFKLWFQQQKNGQLHWFVWSNTYIKQWNIFYNYTLSLTKHFENHHLIQ